MSVKFSGRLRRRCTIQQCNATRRFHPPKKITGRINPAPVETRPRHVSYPRRVTMDVVYIPRFLYDLYLTKIYSARKISRPTIPPQKYSAPKWTWRWRVITLYGVCRRGVGASLRVRCLYTPFFIRFIFDQNISRPDNIPPKISCPKIYPCAKMDVALVRYNVVWCM